MFEVRCPLRWSDLDAQGHVNNAVVVDYLQEARVAFLRAGPASDLLDAGVVVVGHQVEYRRAIDYSDDGVDVRLGVAELGAARIALSYELRQAGELAVVAWTLLCPFDFDAQAPTRIRPEYRGYFEAHRVAAEPMRALAAPSLEGRGTAVPLPVRWTDLDSYGHINNAKVFDYLQQARITATTEWDPDMARVGSSGSRHLWLVARQDVDYVTQMDHRMEPYEVRVAPVALGSSSITLAAEILDPADGTLYVRGRTILVCADLDGRKTPLDDATRRRLEAHLI
ncbi:acyl-CoA thioesterase [Tessaracoccus sp. G1721]